MLPLYRARTPPPLSPPLYYIGMAILPAGVDIRRISDPTGAGVGAIFHPWVRPTPAPRISGCGRGFYFSPVGDPWISEISNFDGFDLVNPPKYPSVLKFWPSPTISPTQVSYRNPRLCSSYSSITFFSWFSNPPWPRDPNPTGAGAGVIFHPRMWQRVWVWAGFYQTRIVAIPRYIYTLHLNLFAPEVVTTRVVRG
jgi:hypothetical protein